MKTKFEIEGDDISVEIKTELDTLYVYFKKNPDGSYLSRKIIRYIDSKRAEMHTEMESEDSSEANLLATIFRAYNRILKDERVELEKSLLKIDRTEQIFKDKVHRLYTDSINLDGAELFARVCNVTGEGMMDGWCWGDGAFYTSTEQATHTECRKDRDWILDGMDWKNPLSSTSWDIDGEEAEEYLQSVMRAMVSQDTDEDLRNIGYYRDYLYWTEWYWDENDLSYLFDGDGKSYDIDLETIEKFEKFKEGDIVCSLDFHEIKRLNKEDKPEKIDRLKYFKINI